MAKKVTRKQLKALVESALQEKYSFKNWDGYDDVDSSTFKGIKKPGGESSKSPIKSTTTTTQFTTAASQDSDAALTPADLKTARDNNTAADVEKILKTGTLNKYRADSGADEEEGTGTGDNPSESGLPRIEYMGKAGKLEARVIAYTDRDLYSGNVAKGAPIFLTLFKGQVVPRAVVKAAATAPLGDNPYYVTTHNKTLYVNTDKPSDVPKDLLNSNGDIKDKAPIVTPYKNASPKDQALAFLKDVDAIYAKGKLEPETTSGELNNLKALLGAEADAQKVFMDRIKNLVNMDDLKKLTEDEGKLEVSDFERLFNNFESLYGKVLKDADTSEKASVKLKAIRQALVDTYKVAKDDNLRKAIAKTLRASKATGAVRATGGTTSGYRIGSTSASGGSVDFQVMEAFGNAFPSAGSLTQRVNQFNGYVEQVNELIASGGKVEGNVDEKFSKFIVLDLLQQILYDFEASSAGWVFESFLAFMAFGEAIGAGYGAGDFTIKNKDGEEIQGSAKLLQKGKTGQNFADVKNGETIRYVIGIKETQVGDTTTPTKQGQRTGLLKIYIMDLTRTGGEAGDESGDVLVTQGSESEKIDISDGRIDIEVLNADAPDAKLDLLFLQANEFQDVSGKIVNDISEQLKKSMEKMSSLKANIDDYVLNYSQEDERMIYSKGALEDYGDLKKILFKDDKLFGGGLAERKITSKFLKKLIEESFKK